MSMATRNTDKPESWWEAALAAIGLGVFLVGVYLGMLMLSVSAEPEERCFSGAAKETSYCRSQVAWQ